MIKEYLHPHDFSEAALQTRFDKKVFWKYAANLQKNTHAEEWFQWRNRSFLGPKFSFFKKKRIFYISFFWLVSCPMTDIKLSLKWLFCTFEKNPCPKWGICGGWMAGELVKWKNSKFSVNLFRFFWNFTSWWRVLKIGYKRKLIFCSKLGKTGILEHINIKVWQYLFLFLGQLILCSSIPTCFTFAQNLFINYLMPFIQKWIRLFFFLSEFSFTGTDDSPDCRGRDNFRHFYL